MRIIPLRPRCSKACARRSRVHRHRLFELYKQKFGEHIPLIRRDDVRGFVKRRPVWLYKPLGLEVVRKQASAMEMEIRRFYEKAAAVTPDASLRQLLGDLAEEERSHAMRADELGKGKSPARYPARGRRGQPQAFRASDRPARAGGPHGRLGFHPRAGLRRRLRHAEVRGTLSVGLAASIGAGISMGFAEALSDDGSLTGRGHPWMRGLVCGLMTTAGGIGHTLPFLIRSFGVATTVAVIVVAFELAAISWIRARYMDTPWLSATLQVVLGGVLVFLTGILIGSA